MTIGEFLLTALRRWYVAVLGGALTLGLFVVLTDGPQLYSGRVTLTVLSPPPADGTNTLQQPAPPIIASAAVMRVNNHPHELASSSPETTLLGRTQRVGDAVFLVHRGNQWNATAQDPAIGIEAVDVSPEAVEARIEARVREVEEAIRALEDELRVARRQRVDLTQTPPVVLAGAATTSRPRALLATGIVGAALTAWAVLGLEAWSRRRRKARA